MRTQDINLANIMEQLSPFYGYIDGGIIIGKLCEKLALELIEPIDILELVERQAENLGEKRIPKWLYQDIGANRHNLNQFISSVYSPITGEDFIEIYTDEWGTWYIDIQEVLHD
nr:MAG TPA: hypothetical protein [Caudoviricetes sp.]